MLKLNNHELRILTSIILKEKARYSDLNSEDLPTNQFNYHLQLLLQEGFIEKDNNIYVLTEKGEELAGDIDIFAHDIERQGKISAVAICKKMENDEELFLMQKRKKQPYYGYCGFPAGKMKYGSSFASEVLRELEEETGMTGKAELKQISHVLVKNLKGKKIVNDFTFFKFLITDLKGHFIQESLEGINQWMTVKQIKKEKHLFPGVLYSIDLLKQKNISFKEITEIYKQEN